MHLLLRLFIAIMKIVYSVCKLLPQNNNRVLFLSRQSDEPSGDFLMLMNSLKSEEVKCICIRDNGDFKSKLNLLLYMFKSLPNLAKAKVCVIDSYWPAVSVLNHRNLKVIQIWHALGKIKKSGYQTLEMNSGRDKKVSEIMKMHKNYDAVIAGGIAWNEYYCKSFGIEDKIIKNYGLPRIDRLIINEDVYKAAVFKLYPKLKEKPLILYAPTFRRGYEYNWQGLLDALDTDKYNLVIKAHPNSPLEFDREKYYSCDELRTEQLLAACDYLITDYSAIAVEGAVLDKKTYYYIFDYEDYIKNNGLNLDIREEFPTLCFKDADEMIRNIEDGYDIAEFERYKRAYLPSELGSSTQKISDLIKDYMRN